MSDENVSRRNFIKAATLTAVAAAATGGGAALLKRTRQTPSAPTSVVSPPVFAQPVAQTTSPDSPDLLARLAAAQADNVRLQAALDAAQRELDALHQSTTSAGEHSEALTLELASVNNQVSLLSGLLALYEQLDGVDMAAVWEQGVSAVSGSFSGLMDKVPSLEEGIMVGQQALLDLENHIPLVENGRNWLTAQINRVNGYFVAIQALLETAVDTVGPFLQMLNDWFQDVLSWLPFGMGDRAGQIAQAITNLLIETPNTLSGLTTNISQPLDVWLARQENETPLHKNLIKPIREQVLAQTGEVMTQAKQIQTTYQTELVGKMETSVASQKLIRDLITQYRQTYNV